MYAVGLSDSWELKVQGPVQTLTLVPISLLTLTGLECLSRNKQKQRTKQEPNELGNSVDVCIGPPMRHKASKEALCRHLTGEIDEEQQQTIYDDPAWQTRRCRGYPEFTDRV